MAVVQLEISRRSPYAGEKSFGDVGAYEQIDGTVITPLIRSTPPMTA